jgi:chorismate synthase
MSIPAIKGAEIGGGFKLAGMPGSQVHDEIYFEDNTGYHRRTNNAGGLEGGMTNGEQLVARACMKPIPTLTKPLRSVDVSSGKEKLAFKERSDVCAVPAAAVVGEAMVAIELACAFLDKFGSDSMEDIKEAYLAYLRRLRGNWPIA